MWKGIPSGLEFGEMISENRRLSFTFEFRGDWDKSANVLRTEAFFDDSPKGCDGTVLLEIVEVENFSLQNFEVDGVDPFNGEEVCIRQDVDAQVTADGTEGFSMYSTGVEVDLDGMRGLADMIVYRGGLGFHTVILTESGSEEGLDGIAEVTGICNVALSLDEFADSIIVNVYESIDGHVSPELA